MHSEGVALSPELDQLMSVYFGEDFDLWGDTVEEIINKYNETLDPAQRCGIVKKIDAFKLTHPHNLDDAFSREYGKYFDPEPWGYTTASFLEELKRLLQMKL